MAAKSGRHFLQIPGPSNVPERVLRAIGLATIDHRSPEFGLLGRAVLEGLHEIFGAAGPVVVFPGSGTGAWEAALVNTLSPGDEVVMFDSGHFAGLWREVAVRFGLSVKLLQSDWRLPVDPSALEAVLREDRAHAIKAVAVVHNETSTGVTSSIPAVREAMNRAGHPALLLVDTVSSLGCMEYQHDAWGVDVTVSGSQKGLMLPPGLGFNAPSAKALAASRSARLPRSYWDWAPMLRDNAGGYFPYTPATNLLYGLREALALLREEGLPAVFARHARHARATQRAVEAWGLDLVCQSPAARSTSLTAVFVPEGHDADALRKVVLERFDMSLGTGLSRYKGKIFRIGHLGSFNDLMLAGTLAGVEMGLGLAGIPHRPGGVGAALEVLAASSGPAPASPPPAAAVRS